MMMQTFFIAILLSSQVVHASGSHRLPSNGKTMFSTFGTKVGKQESLRDSVNSKNTVDIFINEGIISDSETSITSKIVGVGPGGGQSNGNFKNVAKITTLSVVGAIVVHFIFQNKHKLPSKGEIQEQAFRTATSIKEKGSIGIFYFIACVACFEAVGISTGFLEISGGFVYGIRNGFAINAMGKLCGATIAYIIGRRFLATRIRSKFFSNDGDLDNDANKSTKILQMVQTCVKDEPFTTALVMRFSFFPHLLKNLLLSIMEPIHLRMFLSATSMQVLPFTLLFTCLGYDSALRVSNPDLETNRILNGCLAACGIYALTVPTGVVALWYRHKSKKFM